MNVATSSAGDDAGFTFDTTISNAQLESSCV